jgi:hypothetical protein
MTPPDEPVEPDMGKVDDCANCKRDDWLGFRKIEFGRHEGSWEVHCFRCDRSGPPAVGLDAAASAWNQWQKE